MCQLRFRRAVVWAVIKRCAFLQTQTNVFLTVIKRWVFIQFSPLICKIPSICDSKFQTTTVVKVRIFHSNSLRSWHTKCARLISQLLLNLDVRVFSSLSLVECHNIRSAEALFLVTRGCIFSGTRPSCTARVYQKYLESKHE